MEFIWQELAADTRGRSIATSSTTQLSQPITLQTPRSGSQQHFRPAGRVDRSPAPLAADHLTVSSAATGEAFAASVQFLLGAANDFSIHLAIQEELRRATSMVRSVMFGHRYGGLLSVATALVRWDPSQAFGPADPSGRPPSIYYGDRSRTFAGLNVGTIVYERPEHAFRVWQSQDRLEVGTAREGEYLEYRFFWGTWTD